MPGKVHVRPKMPDESHWIHSNSLDPSKSKPGTSVVDANVRTIRFQHRYFANEAVWPSPYHEPLRNEEAVGVVVVVDPEAWKSDASCHSLFVGPPHEDAYILHSHDDSRLPEKEELDARSCRTLLLHRLDGDWFGNTATWQGDEDDNVEGNTVLLDQSDCKIVHDDDAFVVIVVVAAAVVALVDRDTRGDRHGGDASFDHAVDKACILHWLSRLLDSSRQEGVVHYHHYYYLCAAASFGPHMKQPSWEEYRRGTFENTDSLRRLVDACPKPASARRGHDDVGDDDGGGDGTLAHGPCCRPRSSSLPLYLSLSVSLSLLYLVT